MRIANLIQFYTMEDKLPVKAKKLYPQILEIIETLTIDDKYCNVFDYITNNYSAFKRDDAQQLISNLKLECEGKDNRIVLAYNCIIFTIKELISSKILGSISVVGEYEHKVIKTCAEEETQNIDSFRTLNVNKLYDLNYLYLMHCNYIEDGKFYRDHNDPYYFFYIPNNLHYFIDSFLQYTYSILKFNNDDLSVIYADLEKIHKIYSPKELSRPIDLEFLNQYKKIKNKYPKNWPYSSTLEYRKHKAYPSGIDQQEQSFLLEHLCGHGTNLRSVIGALINSNGQLVPGNKLMKLTGELAKTGESGGTTYLNRKYVSTIGLGIKNEFLGYRYYNLETCFEYAEYSSNAKRFLTEIDMNAAQIPVVVIGDGIKQGGKVYSDCANERIYKRLNIRYIAVKSYADIIESLLICKRLNVHNISVVPFYGLKVLTHFMGEFKYLTNQGYLKGIDMISIKYLNASAYVEKKNKSISNMMKSIERNRIVYPSYECVEYRYKGENSCRIINCYQPAHKAGYCRKHYSEIALGLPLS